MVQKIGELYQCLDYSLAISCESLVIDRVSGDARLIQMWA